VFTKLLPNNSCFSGPLFCEALCHSILSQDGANHMNATATLSNGRANNMAEERLSFEKRKIILNGIGNLKMYSELP
jgi:hypothetical protein